MSLPATLFLAALGLAFIVLARSGAIVLGPFGYLLLQAAGLLGLASRRKRNGWTNGAAWVMLTVFVANAVLFLSIFTGTTGPHIVAIAIVLVVLYGSGIAGGFATLVSLLLWIRQPPVRPIAPAAIGAIGIVAGIVIATTVAAAQPAPPPSPSHTPFPTQARVSPTPTPTPTPTPPGVRTFPLTVAVSGNGTVQVDPAKVCSARCVFELAEGSVVTPSPTPGPGSIFAGWGGCDTRGGCSVRMTGPREIRAAFRLPILRVSLGGKARGSVRSDPKGIACPTTCEASLPQGKVTLTASPEGSAFTGWSLACYGLGTCVIDLKADAQAMASFEAFAPSDLVAKPCSEDRRIDVGRDRSVQVSVCFANAGSSTWTRGAATEVAIATCCPVGSPSPQVAWRDGWTSDRIYAGMSLSAVPPNSPMTVTFLVHAPKTAPLGPQQFFGMLIQSRSGAPVMGSAFTLTVNVVP